MTNKAALISIWLRLARLCTVKPWGTACWAVKPSLERMITGQPIARAKPAKDAVASDLGLKSLILDSAWGVPALPRAVLKVTQ